MRESDKDDDYSLPLSQRICVGEEDGVALVRRLWNWIGKDTTIKSEEMTKYEIFIPKINFKRMLELQAATAFTP